MKTLYSNKKQETIINATLLPQKWIHLDREELRAKAKSAVLEISKNPNSELKAKALGFNNAKHLIDLCFDFILK